MRYNVKSSQEAVRDLVYDPDFEGLPISIKEGLLQLFFDMEAEADKENCPPVQSKQDNRRRVYMLQNSQGYMGDMEDYNVADPTYDDWVKYLANN